jgi:3-oxoacyl-[acyl-carrier protein] reductase
MAKAAEIGYVGSLGPSLAGTGVTANAVAPGPILYEGGSWGRRLQKDPEVIADFIKRELPAGRLGTPEEVAAVVCFLCSDQASGLNGTCVPVDGAQSRSHFSNSS